MNSVMLVYQGGIANVFDITVKGNNGPFNPVRLIQSDFRTCEAFANGIAATGVRVRSAYCNQAGDITLYNWSYDLSEAPFNDEFCPVQKN